MRLRPGRRLPGLLLAAAVIYFFATNSGVVWLYLLTALVLALVPVGLVAPVLALKRLRLRPVAVESRGFEPPLRRDRARVFSADRLVLRLETSGNLDACELGPLLLAGGESRAAARSGLSVETDAGRRGLLRVEAIRASSAWPLGVFRATRWLPLSCRVIVNPRYCLPRQAQRAGTREPIGASSRRGQGDQFLGLRQYQRGDSQRRIHWPTVARTGDLMVIDTASEANSPGVFRLGIDADAGPPAADLAVEVIASLLASCVADGRSFRFELGSGGNTGGGWEDAMARLSVAVAGESSTSTGDRATTVTARREGVEIEAGEKVKWLAPDLSLVEVQAALEEMA